VKILGRREGRLLENKLGGWLGEVLENIKKVGELRARDLESCIAGIAELIAGSLEAMASIGALQALDSDQQEKHETPAPHHLTCKNQHIILMRNKPTHDLPTLFP